MTDLHEVLPAIVYALHYLDFGYDDGTPTFERCLEIWTKTVEPALTQEHFGNCTKQPQVCFRCQAEDSVRLANLIEEGLRGG